MSFNFDHSYISRLINEFQSGNKKESYNKFKDYIDSYPKDIVANYNFGCMSEVLGLTNNAISAYNNVTNLDKNHFESRLNLYLIYIKKNQYDLALPLIDSILKIKPGYAPALKDKAIIFYKQDKIAISLDLILKCIGINSKDFLSLNLLGLIYKKKKIYTKAVESFINAIRINPQYFHAYNNLGNCYSEEERFDLAEENFIKALNIEPNFYDCKNNLANLYSLTSRYNEAITLHKKNLLENNKNSSTLFNIGLVYFYKKNFNKAQEFYDKAFLINSNDQKLKKNYSYLLLAKQKYLEAWNFFESRLDFDQFSSKNITFNKVKPHLWKGDKISKNDKVLVIREQGIGDEILYSSMYPDLLKKYPKSFIETDERLLKIFKKSFNCKKNFIPFGNITKNKINLNNFDKVLYAGSLGKIFRNKIEDFQQKRYLIGNKSIIQKINKSFKKLTNKFKIGLSWNSKGKLGADKSINLKLFKPLFFNQFCYFNLQYNDSKNEIKYFEKNNPTLKINLLEEIDLLNDFESVAAVLKNIDLFITVSNSTAHLAGALGVETWLIKPKNHAVLHYWNQPGNKTPWYPSIKLFNYEKSWENTVEIVKKELEKKL